LFAAVSSASGEILINGVNVTTGDYGNYTIEQNETVGTADVSGGYDDYGYGYGELLNYGMVGAATVNSGWFTNLNSGRVNTATVNGGRFSNSYGTVQTAAINGGTFGNLSGTVHTAAVNGGEFYNGMYRDSNGNYYSVGGGSIVDTAVVSGGAFYNGGYYDNYANYYVSGYGTVGNITVSGGVFDNGGIITAKAALIDGTINNHGNIKHTSISGGALSN
jgi:hypothetical protein